MSDNEYMRAYLKRRYWERRATAIKILGGKCCRCGSTHGLGIDHIDLLRSEAGR